MLYKKLDKSYLVYVIKSHRFLIVNSKIFEFLKIYFSSNGYNDFSLRTRQKKSRNFIARDLFSAKYKKRIVKPKKGKGSYKRKKKVNLT